MRMNKWLMLLSACALLGFATGCGGDDDDDDGATGTGGTTGSGGSTGDAGSTGSGGSTGDAGSTGMPATGPCSEAEAGLPCGSDCVFDPASIDCAAACANVVAICASDECAEYCQRVDTMAADPSMCALGCEGTKTLNCTNIAFGCYATSSDCAAVGECIAPYLQ